MIAEPSVHDHASRSGQGTDGLLDGDRLLEEEGGERCVGFFFIPEPTEDNQRNCLQKQAILQAVQKIGRSIQIAIHDQRINF